MVEAVMVPSRVASPGQGADRTDIKVQSWERESQSRSQNGPSGTVGGSPAQSVSTDAPEAKSTVVIIWNCDGSDWCRCAAKKSSWYVAPSTKPSCSTQHKSRGGRERVTCLQGQV